MVYIGVLGERVRLSVLESTAIVGDSPVDLPVILKCPPMLESGCLRVQP